MYSRITLSVQALVDQAFYIVVWIVAAHMWGAGLGFMAYVAASGIHDIGFALRTIALAITERNANEPRSS